MMLAVRIIERSVIMHWDSTVAISLIYCAVGECLALFSLYLDHYLQNSLWKTSSVIHCQAEGYMSEKYTWFHEPFTTWQLTSRDPKGSQRLEIFALTLKLACGPKLPNLNTIDSLYRPKFNELRQMDQGEAGSYLWLSHWDCLAATA